MASPEEDRPLRLLSLDGGGVRGLSSLYILQYVMEQVKEEEKLPRTPRPCDYFDMIAGTSTGGIIAIMLGVLEMDVETCIDKYIKLSREVFPEDNMVSRLKLVQWMQVTSGSDRFDHKKLERVIKDIVSSRMTDLLSKESIQPSLSLGNTPMNFRVNADSTLPRCKVFVCATAERQTVSVPLRNYKLRGAAQAGNLNCSIWEACRATSAAPTFFKPVTIGPNRTKFYDGALNYNNPTDQLRVEAGFVWKDRKIGCLISIGTGLQQLKDVFKGLKIVETLKAKITQTEDTHKTLAKAYQGRKTYYRFDVDQGLDRVRLNEADKNDLIEIATHRYMDGEIGRVQECVSQLLHPSLEISKGDWPQHNYYKYGPSLKDLFEKPLGSWERMENFCFSRRDPKTSNPRQIYVHGMPGTGKTTLCDRFAIENAHKFWAVFRIDASGPVSIQNGFIDIAKQLGKNLDKIQLTDALSKRPWLLVLDDEDMAYQEEIDRYITLHANATVLISTRRRVGGGKSRIELKEMQLNEATNLLLRRVGFWTPKFDDGDFRNSVRALVQDDLGSNPLAILQAGAVIDASYPISIHSFRKRFASLADGPQTLLQRPHGESDYPYPSVWKTFQMCFERIKAAAERDDDQEAVLARNALELIRFFAFLSADVPEEFLLNALRKVFSSKTVGKQTYPLELLHQAKSSEPIIFSLDVIKPACKILDQFSLIEPLQKTVLRHGDYVSDHHTYRLHTLVKTCVHLDLRTEKTAEISSNSWLKAMHTLSCALAFNPDVLDENLQRLSLPHIKACTGTKCLAARVAEYGEQANLDFIWLHFARLYLRGRKPNEALRLQREVLEYRESQGNPKLLVLDAKHEIASSKRGLGDLEGALKDRQEVLRDLQKLGSPTQDLRLFAMENLADSYNDFGRFEEALSLQLSVVQAFESSGRFVELWSARAKLAGILSQIGQDHESLKIREEIFKYRKIHGNPLDYNLLLAMTHLSHSLLKSGYLVRARKLREEVLHRMCTIYEDKDTHPDILDAKSDLATILDAFEEWDHAMRLKEEVIRCREHVFGRHHPETWKAMNSIALHYKRRNMLEDSLSWHQQVLSLYKSSENPRLVLQAEDEITRIEHTMLFNDYQDKTVGREGLEKRAKALVSKRLSLLNTWQHYFDDDLSNIWQATHFLIDAYFDFPAFFDRWKAHEKRQSILREQLVKCKENAPEVLYTQLRLANGWSRLYESDRAIRICQEVVEARVNTLGEQHPDTVDSREYLAYLFFRSSSSRDNHESALSIYRTLLVLHEQTKGPSHPKVAFVTEQIRKLEHLFDDDEGQSTGESVTTAQSLSRPPTAKSDSIKGNEVVTKSYGSGKLPTRSPTNEREQPKRLLSHTDVRDFVADS